jgi:hypothetical protein
MHPVSYTKGAVENQILRGARGRGRRHSTQRSGTPRRTQQITMSANLAGAIALAIIIVDLITSVYVGIKDSSFGEFFVVLLFGFIVLGVFMSKVRST